MAACGDVSALRHDRWQYPFRRWQCESATGTESSRSAHQKTASAVIAVGHSVKQSVTDLSYYNILNLNRAQQLLVAC